MNKKSQEGHRARLADKFLKAGISALHDYEIVELLITLGQPRKNCKEMAKEAMKRFKTLRGVLEASREELLDIKGLGPKNILGLKLVMEVAREALKEKLTEKPLLKSSKEIFDYLYQSMRGLKKEVFKVIFLNGQNKIIEIEDLFAGSVNVSAVYPREVMKSALKYNAVALVFAHNHPTGNPTPSRHDKKITEDLKKAADLMQIKVLDHIIIGDNKYFSFADKGILQG